MEFFSVIQGCPVDITIDYRNGAPSVTGHVYPYDGSDEYAYFSISQDLDVRAESARVVMIPILEFPKHTESLTDAHMVMKAINVAYDQMRHYHALLVRFNDLQPFIAALYKAAERQDDALMAEYLMLCPFISGTSPKDLDQVMVSVMTYCPPRRLEGNDIAPPLRDAIMRAFYHHPDFDRKSGFLGFYKAKAQELGISGYTGE